MTKLTRETGETQVTVELTLRGDEAASAAFAGAGRPGAVDPGTLEPGARRPRTGQEEAGQLWPGQPAAGQPGGAGQPGAGQPAAGQRAAWQLVGDAAAATASAPTIATGEPFLDHMLTAFRRYSGLGLRVTARGDLRHHLVEDVAITVGLALRRALPATCARYGSALVPMDDALVQVALDLGGRAWYDGPLPVPLAEHALRSFASNAEATLHVAVLRGSDRHHVVEAAVKALGLAVRAAVAPGGAVFSTKGAVTLRWEEG